MRAIGILALSFLATGVASGATFVVDDLGDAADAAPTGVCATAGAVCTLRAAIEEANAQPGADTITFSVMGVIAVGSPLPGLTGQTTVDGTTAPGYAGTPVVIVDGAMAVNIGLEFAAGSGSSLVRGLQLHGFSQAAVVITADGVSVQRNVIGGIPAVTINVDGIQLSGNGSTIGGPGEGNVIGRNERHGIAVVSGTGHTISDNLIGVDAAGNPFPNFVDGIHVFGPASGIDIGGTAGSENTISGNGNNGVVIESASAITVAGNFIGTDPAGTLAVPNGSNGILLTTATGNFIGAAGRTTVISGNNNGNGIWIDIDSTGNVVDNCLIGVDTTGLAAIGNRVGVQVDASNNTIGMPLAGNVISGNDLDGIAIALGAAISDVTVQSNIIGLAADGTSILGNGGAGVLSTSASSLLIGGTGAGEGNVISGNSSGGIIFLQVSDSRIEGNTIGLDQSGTAAAGNLTGGLVTIVSDNITIGAPGNGMNVVSANDGDGITILSGLDHIVQNNHLGTNRAGTAGLGNFFTGVVFVSSSGGFIRSNLISGNLSHGIELTAGSDAVVVHSNTIGLSAGPSPVAIPNDGDGVNVCDSVFDNVIGSETLGGNTIANNGANGIGVEPTALLNNRFVANSIFANTGLPIDLEQDGVTPNDLLDPDPGPNNLQNFPVVTWAVDSATQTAVEGTLNSEASSPYEIHIYKDATYLGRADVTTDGAGNATFSFAAPLVAGTNVLATATGAAGTSEFSAPAAVAPAPTVQFSAPAYAVSEAGVTVTITVTRTGDLGGTSTVAYATSNGTAAAGSDYTAAAGTLTFAPAVAAQTFDITILNDVIDENDETVNLTLSSPSAATLGAQLTAVLTITDDDVPPSVSIDDVSLAEGSGGTTGFVFTATLSAASALPVTVNYATADDTAAAPSDYAVATGMLTFAPGVLTQTVTVNVAGDLTTEPNETFFVNLTGPVNATLADAQGLGTIVNDDAIPSMTIGDVMQNEGNAGTTAFVFTVTLSNPSASIITVDYATADDTAAAPSDYAAASSTLNFAPGVVAQTITVNVAGDLTTEVDETFFVNLTAPANATIADAQALGTIVNDEGVPSLTINDVSLNEGNAGTTAFVFTVKLSNPSASNVTVDYTTADGTAAAGSDYTAAAGTLTFAPGVVAQTITVDVLGDTTVEPDETFVVNLTNAVGSIIADAQGAGTIAGDDASLGADLSVTKAAIVIATKITYTIVVANAGPDTATGVTMTDVLPSRTVFVSATTTSGSCSGTTTVTCAIGTLAVGASATITIVLESSSAGRVNPVSVSANEPDPNPANNTAVHPYAITTLAEWMLITLIAALGLVAIRRL